MVKPKAQGAFFNSLDKDKDFDPEKFLTEVEAQFSSEEITKEVNWRLKALRKISGQPELKDVREGLRNKLTQIFSVGGEENEILENLKALTEIKRADGDSVEIRRFLTRDKRTLNESEYRKLLEKKIQNTQSQIINLTAFFSESQKEMKKLSDQVGGLIKKINNLSLSTKSIKAEEDTIRAGAGFQSYEKLKMQFLKDWLAQFGATSPEELENMSAEEVQQMVIEHQRHQMTHLLKTQIVISNMDMTSYLGLHDTLETDFKDKDFWAGANVAAKAGFKQWILSVIQAFGMLKGQRYAFFQSKDDKNQFLLFCMGIDEFPGDPENTLKFIPCIKPFTKKGGYMLEIRQREINDPEQYYHELRHYVLPFLFAFDQMPNFTINKDLISFFTSNY